MSPQEQWALWAFLMAFTAFVYLAMMAATAL